MSVRNFIPNFFTSLNLVFGCLAIIEIFEGELQYVIYYTMLSGVADFFDGFLARQLNSTSNIGKDLDSLADMVSFGVVPSLVMYQLIEKSIPGTLWPYVAVLITVMSGLRLAKFNNDERQSDRFFGLPTPANAFLINSLAYLSINGEWTALLDNWWVLVIISLATAVLLVLDVPMMAFKFKHFGWQDNILKYSFIMISIVMLVTLKLAALPLIIMIYIIGSLLSHWLSFKF